MLYISFRFILFFTSVMGIISMVAEDSCTYIFFPVVCLLWVLYTFFRENDEEYKRRNGYYFNTTVPNKRDYWPLDDIPDEHYVYNDNINKKKAEEELIYKNIAKRCKRTFKITIAKQEQDGEK
jgi:hypothetical protein